MKKTVINDKQLDIEIYKSRSKFTILAFDISEMYKLCFSLDEAALLMEDSTSYDDLLSKLKYEDGNLVLVEQS